MPRILKSKKKLLLCGIFLIAVGLLFTPIWYVSLFLAACFACLCLNILVVKQNMRPHRLAFSPKREIRAWSALVIGNSPPPLKWLEDTLELNKEQALLLLSPDRSMEASYQILLHAGSVLNKNGKVIILNHGRRRKSKAYTIFDIPYLGLIARKQLGLESQRCKVRYPLLFEPTRSLKLLLGIGSKQYVIKECPHEEMVRYCRRKGFNLTYMESS